MKDERSAAPTPLTGARKPNEMNPAAPASLESGLVGVTMEPLWCVHMLGMDDLHGMPSKARALEHANDMNKFIGRQERTEFDPFVLAVVVEWPYSPEDHAKSVASFLAEEARLAAARAVPGEPT